MFEKQLVSGSDAYNTQLLYFTSSSLSSDDKRVTVISDKDGHPNLYCIDQETNEEIKLSDNHEGFLKSYVYFNGTPGRGLGKASVCLDSARNIVYYIQGNEIIKAGLDGSRQVLNTVPQGQVTAFTHVSADGSRLVVPTTDERALEYDLETEGRGLDRRPIFSIDQRVISENLSSYLHIYDTATGKEILCEPVPRGWVTHVQFHPKDHNLIMYNHEWTRTNSGFRRIWLFDGKKHIQMRTPASDRIATDSMAHEMWSSDGKYVIYHGILHNFDPAPARPFLGRIELDTLSCWEIPLPEQYSGYGHFTISHDGRLVSDGYYTDGEAGSVHDYISVQDVDWENKKIVWTPLCKHGSDWSGQDAHPHPIFNNRGDFVYFTSGINGTVKVYRVACK